MKKKTKITLIVIGSLLVVYFSLHLSGGLRHYKVTSIAGYPNLKKGEYFFVSTLKKPKRFDLVCFYADIPNEGHTLVVHRLCGLPGDKIEIKNGTLYLNDNNADTNLGLSNFYIVPEKDEYKILEYEPIDKDFYFPLRNDSLLVNLSDKTIRDNNLSYPKYTLGFAPNMQIQEVYHKPWNADNFGPLIIPNGHYFVLGDNRPNCLDSRYLGPIDQKNHFATVVFK